MKTGGGVHEFRDVRARAAVQDATAFAGRKTIHVPASVYALGITAPNAGVTNLDGGEPAAGSPPIEGGS